MSYTLMYTGSPLFLEFIVRRRSRRFCQALVTDILETSGLNYLSAARKGKRNEEVYETERTNKKNTMQNQKQDEKNQFLFSVFQIKKKRIFRKINIS